MTDIVTSLRALYPTHPIVLHAADEIEKLRAERQGMTEDELMAIARALHHVERGKTAACAEMLRRLLRRHGGEPPGGPFAKADLVRVDLPDDAPADAIRLERPEKEP